MKNLIIPLLIILCIIIMLCSPETSVYGASCGILLWFNNILPSLLPFMIATNIIIKLNVMIAIQELLYKYFRHIKIPVHIIYIIFTGFLCGFPMGAKVINDFRRNGDISDNEASWLISFCNLPSPMFIISYAATECLRLNNSFIFISAFYLPLLIIVPISYIYYKNKSYKAKLYICNISSKQHFYLLQHNSKKVLYEPGHTFLQHKKNNYDSVQTNYDNINFSKKNSDAPKEHRLSISMIENSMTNSYIAIAKIGGYMVIFSIIAAFLEEAYYIAPLIRGILICLAEMTTGISLVSGLNISIHIKTILCLAALSIGGMSCIAQTTGVISSTNIKISHYIIWRLIHAVLSVLLYSLIISMH